MSRVACHVLEARDGVCVCGLVGENEDCGQQQHHGGQRAQRRHQHQVGCKQDVVERELSHFELLLCSTAGSPDWEQERDTVTAPRPGAASLRPAHAVSSHVAPRRVHVTPRHVARASHAATHVLRSDAARLMKPRPRYTVSGRGGHGAAWRVTSATSVTRMPGSATHTLSPLRYIQPRDGGRSWTSLLLWIMPVDLTEVTAQSKLQDTFLATLKLHTLGRLTLVTVCQVQVGVLSVGVSNERLV